MGRRLVHDSNIALCGRLRPIVAFAGEAPRAEVRSRGQAAAWLLHPEALIGRTPKALKEFSAP